MKKNAWEYMREGDGRKQNRNNRNLTSLKSVNIITAIKLSNVINFRADFKTWQEGKERKAEKEDHRSYFYDGKIICVAIAISGFMYIYHNKSQGRENVNYLLRLLLRSPIF